MLLQMDCLSRYTAEREMTAHAIEGSMQSQSIDDGVLWKTTAAAVVTV